MIAIEEKCGSSRSIFRTRLLSLRSSSDHAVRLDPASPHMRIQSARSHALAGNHSEALLAVDRALASGSPAPPELILLASILFHCDKHERALALYQTALRLEPGNSEAVRGKAMALRALGRIEEAEHAADEVLAVEPRDCEMLHMRSSLRRQTPGSNHIDQLRALLGRGVSRWREAVQLWYALAKELEDLGRYEESFDALRNGATLKRRHMQYDVHDDLGMLRQISSAFQRSLFESLKGSGYAAEGPIFVLGLPRTGTTLVERIISSHPEVESLGELNTFALEMMRHIGQCSGSERMPKSQMPLASTRINMRSLGAGYMRSAGALGAGKRYFVDKMPMNSLYVGLIHLALPNARIVLVERDAADCCYAMYKFLFRDAYPFSYDLEEVAQYFLAHKELTDHWLSALPGGSICRVPYEKLVSDQERCSRGIMHNLGIPWSDKCLEFERNALATTTGSATQVRRPIYTSSVGMWRNYQRQLTPMLRILRSGGIDCH